ncbi:hypothetical protein RJD38_14755 [Vibrio scophthalmi]|nr:hypothetical protein [Vibrio scophthalmi]ANS85330.1 hypothetical protein VSVS12_01563 [Vibrio scophthalmi]
MHAKSLRTIWLVLLTALTLVASNMASSKTLMPIQMLQMGQHNLSSCTPEMMSDMASATSHHQMMPSTSATEDCSSNDSLYHECCDTTCITVLAALLAEPTEHIRIAHAVSFPLESHRDIIEIARSLYRPPNA